MSAHKSKVRDLLEVWRSELIVATRRFHDEREARDPKDHKIAFWQGKIDVLQSVVSELDAALK